MLTDIMEGQADSEKWIDEELWTEIILSIPIACADVAFEQRRPVHTLWVFDHSSLQKRLGVTPRLDTSWREACRKHVKDCGRVQFEFRRVVRIGVFHVKLRTRSGVSIGVWVRGAHERPKANGKELAKAVWKKIKPPNLDSDYELTIDKYSELADL
jgi:hypothetical protein